MAKKIGGPKWSKAAKKRGMTTKEYHAWRTAKLQLVPRKARRARPAALVSRVGSTDQPTDMPLVSVAVAMAALSERQRTFAASMLAQM